MHNYTLEEIYKIDAELRELQSIYAKARVKIGLEMAKRLIEVDKYNLYKKLDERSYPNFNRYLESIGIRYKTAREVMGLYQAFILAGGKTMKELEDAEYHKLTIVKKECFKYENKQYLLKAPEKEIDEWIALAKSNITQEDLKQRVREEKAGEHEHQWMEFKYKICSICKLKEFKK